jgi:cytoskeletal protein RodZ
MTTRDEARRGTKELRPDTPRPSSAPEPTASLPERLYAARERKGVDLYRAERDTKIRSRYLAALERGEYKELPGAVYTKGFLRNYALYLGLDPDEVLVQWRRERGDNNAPAQPVIAVPRPIAPPRRGLTFSPGVVVAALLTVVVLGVGAYLAVQVLRYAKPPTLEVTTPAVATTTVPQGTASYTLKGTTIPGGTVTVDAASGSRQATADSTGAWTIDVDLRHGKNQFTIDATDPDTGKHAETTAQVVITVPFAEVGGPGLTIDQPADGATVESGAIQVHGVATTATSVSVSATYEGPLQGATASPGPSSPPAQAPVDVPVGADGSFSTPLQLATGRWSIAITASGAAGIPTIVTRHVSVGSAAVVPTTGVNLVVDIKGGRAWIKVWVDGKLATQTGGAGKVYQDGKTITFHGKTSVEVRTGSSGATVFTLNGKSLGALGKRGVPETWLFGLTGAPKKTQHQ